MSDNFLLSAIVSGNYEVVALLLEDDTPHPWDVLFLRGCGVAAAWQGSAETLQILCRSPRARHHLTFIEDKKALNDLDALIPDEPVLHSLSPVVIAACRLHVEAVQFLLHHGAVLPSTIPNGPLLAYWASHVDGSRPAALPMLRLLLDAGLDPLAFGVTPTHAQGRAEPVGGRIGTLSSFLLTCTHPQLLGAAVRHVLAQCAAAAPLGRSLTPVQVAVMLVAARMAGLQPESEQLLAQAAYLADCFPSATPPHRVVITTRNKRQRLAKGAWNSFHSDCRTGSGSDGEMSTHDHSEQLRRILDDAVEQQQEQQQQQEQEQEQEQAGMPGQALPLELPASASTAPQLQPQPVPSANPLAQHQQWRQQPQVPTALQYSREEHEAVRQQLAAVRARRRAIEERVGDTYAYSAAHSFAAFLSTAYGPEWRAVKHEEHALVARLAAYNVAARAAQATQEQCCQPPVPSLGAAAPPASASPAAPTAAAAAPTAAAAGAAAINGAGPSTIGSRPLSSAIAAHIAKMRARASGGATCTAAALQSDTPGAEEWTVAWEGEGGERVAAPAAGPAAPRSHTDWHNQLRAQLVADAALHGLEDVLELLLSQGASASATVPWLQQRAVPIPSAALPTSAVTDRLAADAISAELEPVALAAAAGHARCVALLLRRGARVDVHVVRHIVWSLNAAGLEALMSHRVQPLPPSHPCSFAEGPMHCPILLLLLRHLEAVTATKRAFERRRGGGVVGGGTSLVRRLGQQAVQMMDLLYAAGYRLQVYLDTCGKGADGVWRMKRHMGLQPAEEARLKLTGRNRLLWQAYCRPKWSLEAHRTFPPAFRAATRSLLLIARWGPDKQRQAPSGGLEELHHRQGTGDVAMGSEQEQEEEEQAAAVATSALARIPRELLQKIVCNAAYPLSNWMCVGAA